jgi:prepilin-type N-terminal cleavage/methylation domain-containing protein
MSTRTPARRGFTLIELLLVISIIAILASLTFSLFKAAKNGNNKATAKGEITALATACEMYKKMYGDYPCRNTGGIAGGDDPQFRKDLFDQIMGRRVLVSTAISSGGTAVALKNYNDATLPGGSTRKMKPFLNVGAVNSNDDKSIGLNDWTGGSAAAYEFRDPWGNPYDYRYRILPSSSTAIQNASTGAYVTPFSYWLAPGFLIVSCGSNFIEPANPNDAPTFADYWDDSGANPMSKTGIVPATYGDESNTAGPFRSDNITNWTN